MIDGFGIGTMLDLSLLQQYKVVIICGTVFAFFMVLLCLPTYYAWRAKKTCEKLADDMQVIIMKQQTMMVDVRLLTFRFYEMANLYDAKNLDKERVDASMVVDTTRQPFKINE